MITHPTEYRLDHLQRLSDRRGIHEHASGTVPRQDCGYCTDDNARLLIVASRAGAVHGARSLARLGLDSTVAAQAAADTYFEVGIYGEVTCMPMRDDTTTGRD